jgi:hypothetical protein
VYAALPFSGESLPMLNAMATTLLPPVVMVSSPLIVRSLSGSSHLAIATRRYCLVSSEFKTTVRCLIGSLRAARVIRNRVPSAVTS